MGFLSNLFTKKPDSILLESAKSGRLEKVISALVDGASIEARDKEGNTALTLAVINGCRLVVDYLISEKAAVVNTSNSDGCTPLMYAASVGHVDILSWLVDKGADIEIKNEDGFTALMWAAYVGNAKSVNALLERGADVRARNAEGKRAIDLAETADCQKLIKEANERRKALMTATESLLLHSSRHPSIPKNELVSETVVQAM